MQDGNFAISKTDCTDGDNDKQMEPLKLELVSEAGISNVSMLNTDIIGNGASLKGF